MKKYLTLFSVIALFFAGTQFSNAQENRQQTPESIAKFKTHKMHELVELSGDQQREIFTLLVDAETNLAALNTSTMNIQNTQSARAEVMNSTNARIKTILTRDQYVVYKKYLDKENEQE
jgi:hypothetical protein